MVGAGISGDTDGDGDIDVILSYGARSFSILDAEGRVVFDSGDHIERFIASQGIFNASTPASSGAYDDTRSDDKGPEPEGVTVATIGDRTLAFVGLERGGGGVMVYDVTDISNVQFVTYARNAADVSPEGLTYVAAEDSPTGQALLAVTNELSLSLSVYGLTRIVHGDENSNVLASVAGVDELTGGAGKDFFDFNKVGDIGTAASIRDVITDFTQRVDKIDLSTIDANILKEGDQKFNWAPALSGKAGQLVVEQNEGVTLVMGDVNGDAIADFTIELLGVPRLTPQDIIF